MLKINNLNLFRVQIPMLASFEHAAGARNTTDNFICRVELSDGSIGYGEGVPRKHVTGETVETCFNLFDEKLINDLGINSFQSSMGLHELDSQLSSHFRTVESYRSNAARAALEMSLLDSLGHSLGLSVRELLLHKAPQTPRDEKNGRHRRNGTFSLVLGRNEMKDQENLRRLATDYDVVHDKLKVGFDLTEDLTNIDRVRKIFGNSCSIRLDANQAWPVETAIAFLDQACCRGLHGIEDPIKYIHFEDHIEKLRKIKETVECPIILDETVRNMSELSGYLDHQIGDVYSLRVSKCGGFIQSLAMARRILAAGKEIQVGCQVGETALLSAAGRHLADFVSPKFIEGSNERFKFSPDHYLSYEDLGYDRKMECDALKGPGFGVRIIEPRLARFTVEQRSLHGAHSYGN